MTNQVNTEVNINDNYWLMYKSILLEICKLAASKYLPNTKTSFFKRSCLTGISQSHSFVYFSFLIQGISCNTKVIHFLFPLQRPVHQKRQENDCQRL